MTNPLHAAYYADRACHERVTIVENVQIARDTYRVRFAFPRLARHITPGQFLMLRLAGYGDPLLGRPLALYDTVLQGGAQAQPTGVDIVYLVMGKMTRELAKLAPGQELEVWGPLGNGFPPVTAEHLIMVAGGIGQTPFLALAREATGRRQYGEPPRQVAPVSRVTLCYGARSKDLLAGLDDFAALGVDIQTATDDGTAGHHGLVTDVARDVLASSPDAQVICCGPEPMMEAMSEIAVALDVACQVSLETPMACGIGICFSCVAKVRDASGSWDYRRTCVEGPVFDARAIEW